MSRSRLRRAAGLLAAPTGFGAAVVVLVLAGQGDLAPPPLDGFGAWLEARGPITAAMALLRLAALAAAAWMLVVVTVAAVASALGASGLAAATGRAVPLGLRRVLTGLAGVGVASAAVVGAGARAPDVPALAAGPTAAQPTQPTQPTQPAHATQPAPPAPPAEPPVETVTMAVVPEDESWTVEPGDSFWSIAEELRAEALGRPPTDAEIVPYWRALIDANRDRLVSGDPDLILPGQVLHIPAPSGP